MHVGSGTGIFAVFGSAMLFPVPAVVCASREALLLPQSAQNNKGSLTGVSLSTSVEFCDATAAALAAFKLAAKPKSSNDERTP